MKHIIYDIERWQLKKGATIYMVFPSLVPPPETKPLLAYEMT
jgi:hypothetical protein